MARKKPDWSNKPLTKRQQDFCIYYVETGNALDSYRRAGYKSDNKNSAGCCSYQLLNRPRIQAEIKRLQEPILRKNKDKIRKEKEEQRRAIMTSQEVMEHLTAIARGEEKDQFGLDISAADRIKALIEIAKRTVDIDNRATGKSDGVIEIKLDWKRDEQ